MYPSTFLSWTTASVSGELLKQSESIDQYGSSVTAVFSYTPYSLRLHHPFLSSLFPYPNHPSSLRVEFLFLLREV